MSTIEIGASASSLPTTTAQRGIGRDHRYVIVRSSISSPIADAMNIGGSTASTSSWNAEQLSVRCPARGPDGAQHGRRTSPARAR